MVRFCKYSVSHCSVCIWPYLMYRRLWVIIYWLEPWVEEKKETKQQSQRYLPSYPWAIFAFVALCWWKWPWMELKNHETLILPCFHVPQISSIKSPCRPLPTWTNGGAWTAMVPVRLVAPRWFHGFERYSVSFLPQPRGSWGGFPSWTDLDSIQPKVYY